MLDRWPGEADLSNRDIARAREFMVLSVYCLKQSQTTSDIESNETQAAIYQVEEYIREEVVRKQQTMQFAAPEEYVLNVDIVV